MLGAYPVGSIYLSVNNTSPASLFGGSWEKIKDKFLLSSGDTYSLGATGGEATHKLTENEMPSHRHSYGEPRNTGGDWSCLGDPCNMNTSLNPNDSLVFHGYTFYTGGGQAHNNMPPYLVVNVWKRIS